MMVQRGNGYACRIEVQVRTEQFFYRSKNRNCVLGFAVGSTR
jgi:hypothetical protein